jgi:hypothetical protein
VLDFRPHDYALLFPPISEKELDELTADIKKNGLLNAIVLLDGQILDGVQRFTACKRGGVEGRFVNWDDFSDNVKAIGPLTFVISQNLPRRHLPTEQRIEIALKSLPLLKKEAKERMSFGASLDASKGKAAAKVAALAGVSTSTIERRLRKQRQWPEPEDEPAAALPAVEFHFRELAKDVRDAITKVLHTYNDPDWPYGKRAWLCRKAASKLSTLAVELSKQERLHDSGT